MKRYLLDTNILTDFLNRRYGVEVVAEREKLAGCYIGTSISVVGEMYFGASRSDNPTHNRMLVRRGIERVTCWPFTLEAAEVFGNISAMLKSKGLLIQQVDMQTAAIALTLGNCTIVTTDSDFARIPGIVTENWRLPSS